MLSEIETPLVSLQNGDGQPLSRGSLDTAQLSELPGVPLINLRLDPADAALSAAVRQAIGVDLPVAPNTVAQAGDRLALWLAPDEWLLRCVGDDPAGLVADIGRAAGAGWFAVTDQTSGYSVMHLHGPQASAVLNAGCPLDLHPRVLRLGQCAQTHFFRTSILLRPLADDGQAWELIVRRSFADYAARLLLDAMGL
ncbi:sarcosine oxidase subunit gamma [Castellaniella hirudinis]|uniref:sarcosine oxidase subunit gamma n=1 Tax=Castellaniella hirudinis TaxID=1144617 RepID=UPI0039C37379